MKNVMSLRPRSGIRLLAVLFAGGSLALMGCSERRGWSGGSSSSGGAAVSFAPSSSSSSPSRPASSFQGDPNFPSLPAPEAPRGSRYSPSRGVPSSETDLAEMPGGARSVPRASGDRGEIRGSKADPSMTDLKRPPEGEEESLRSEPEEQPLEVARADSIPDRQRSRDDASSEDPSSDEKKEDAGDSRGSSSKGTRKPAPQEEGSYRIEAGDDLDLVFVESWAKGTEYRLLPGDEIRVEYVLGSDAGGNNRSPLDRTVRLQPDGMISLPYIGVVSASGMTVRELGQQLTGQYQDLYVNPNILVSLVSTGGGLEELQRALQSAGGRTTRVAPDGTIMVPFLGSVAAEGLALVELEEEMNERFRRAAPGFGVMVRLAGRP